MDPATIAALLRELAVYYELDGDRHRAFAYERASQSVAAANGLPRLIDEGKVEELPGVGPSIARVIVELWKTGTVPLLERQRATWPPVVIELSQLPKVGVPKARKIYEALKPENIDMVAAAAKAGQLREIGGIGKLSETKILAAIEQRKLQGGSVLHSDALPSAESLAAYLRAGACERVEICGPLRRWMEVVDHLAFAVATNTPDAMIDRLAAYGLITSVDRSTTPVIGFMAGGLRTEMHLAPAAKLGWAQLKATGSKEHVALLEARARDRGMNLDILEAADEAHVYTALGMPFVPPELRDGTDEIAMALDGDTFSDLITLDDLRVATHCHTTYSDGRNSVAEMVRAAAELGYQAITITDHSAAASYAGGLDLAQLYAQAAEIAALEAPEARVFRGTEADINIDGTIDVPAEIVPELDIVIASIHQRFQLDEDGATSRLVNMMRQPFFKIWGHALGRMLLRRDPVKVRIDEVLDAAAESRVAIELNGDPHRLDLDPINARKAAARGIKFVLSSDAHSTKGIAMANNAVHMARRARIRKHQVLNALPPDEFAAIVRPVR
ncbi:MAG TPA: PHP domain-containing protein [Kofleriaceae bacterium]|jgi:DNA polymerase (family 10)